jgi:hypothetical protein
MFIAVFAVALVIGGIVGLLNPDPTPEPVLPPDPAQQIIFVLMLVVGLVLSSIIIRGLLYERRELRRIRRDKPTPPGPH